MKKEKSIKGHGDNFMKYRFLLNELVHKNIKLQYRDSVLGMLWTFLQPLLTMIVLSLVFNELFGRDSSKVVNYPVYLLCGRLLFEFYTSSTKRAMRSIRGRAGIIKKVYVPKYVYPLSSVISTFVTSLISLSVLVVVILFFNIANIHPIHITWRVVLAIVPILILFVFSLGVGMILATLSVFFRDIENIYDVVCLLLFYVTPIVYTPDRLGFAPGSIQLKILKLNPLYGIIDMFRACVIWGGDAFWSHWSTRVLIYCSTAAVFCLVLGFLLFYK
ncbi:MAG: ABC transporter permease, partial [Acutalibacteraceae bacterium]